MYTFIWESARKDMYVDYCIFANNFVNKSILCTFKPPITQIDLSPSTNFGHENNVVRPKWEVDFNRLFLAKL